MRFLRREFRICSIRAVALLVVALCANVALAYQVANPGALAIVVSASSLGQYGPYGRPMTEYRCLTCGQRFSHYVTRCPTCAAVGRMNRDSSRRSQKALEKASRQAAESRRKMNQQIAAARKKSSDDDSNYSSGRRIGRLVRWVLVAIVAIASGIGYMNRQQKQKRRDRLSKMRGTPANPTIDIPGAAAPQRFAEQPAEANEFGDITDFAEPQEPTAQSAPPRRPPVAAAATGSQRRPPAARPARPAPAATPPSGSRPKRPPRPS